MQDGGCPAQSDFVRRTGHCVGRVSADADRNIQRCSTYRSATMKVPLGVFFIPFQVALLTWLSIRAVNPEAEQYDRVLAELDRFSMLEAALHRDVLSARAGILRNYDPLVRETNALDAS